VSKHDVEKLVHNDATDPNVRVKLASRDGVLLNVVAASRSRESVNVLLMAFNQPIEELRIVEHFKLKALRVNPNSCGLYCVIGTLVEATADSSEERLFLEQAEHMAIEVKGRVSHSGSISNRCTIIS
jgi:hypothetical protein